MAMMVLNRMETVEVVRSGHILGVLEKRPKEFADKLEVKTKHDLKLFVLSHWLDAMEKTKEKGKVGVYVGVTICSGTALNAMWRY